MGLAVRLAVAEAEWLDGVRQCGWSGCRLRDERREWREGVRKEMTGRE